MASNANNSEANRPIALLLLGNLGREGRGAILGATSTHATCFLLKLCGFLGVCHGPLHEAHRLVHVALDPVNHPTLRCGGCGARRRRVQSHGTHSARKS